METTSVIEALDQQQQLDARIVDKLDPKKVRCDIFKRSGKWYETIELDFTGIDTGKDVLIHEACRKALARTQYKPSLFNLEQSGMFAVILAPYHYYSYPFVIWLK